MERQPHSLKSDIIVGIGGFIIAFGVTYKGNETEVNRVGGQNNCTVEVTSDKVVMNGCYSYSDVECEDFSAEKTTIVDGVTQPKSAVEEFLADCYQAKR